MKSASSFTAFKIVHRALLIGQVLFIGVMFYMVYSKTLVPPLAAQDKIFQVIAILFAATAFFAGNTVFKKRMAAIRDGAAVSTKEKFEKYRAACIVQWALLEGAALFSGICFFLTSNYAFLALATTLILLFAMQAPNKTKAALQLGLGITDMDEL
jgi:hypothetical protein